MNIFDDKFNTFLKQRAPELHEKICDLCTKKGCMMCIEESELVIRTELKVDKSDECEPLGNIFNTLFYRVLFNYFDESYYSNGRDVCDYCSLSQTACDRFIWQKKS